MFQINDTIIYGTQGVCQITGIETKSIEKTNRDYFVLKPLYQNSSLIFVPIDNEKLKAKMRKILSAKEIKKLIDTIPQEETVWIEDDAVRKERYKEMIASGDCRQLVRLIKTLYREEQARKSVGKRLHQNDEITFKKAETLLYNEFALVLNIAPEEVVPFLCKQFDQNKIKEKK